MIKVLCDVKTYDNETHMPTISVQSHWNEDRKVVLEVDGKHYTVVADDLIAAIKNCTNTRRF